MRFATSPNTPKKQGVYPAHLSDSQAMSVYGINQQIATVPVWVIRHFLVL